MTEKLPHMRTDYVRGDLDEATAADEPFAQFTRWFADAQAALADAGGGTAGEANAVTLATADASGRPSARVVLLKGVDARGFTFFTNYGSQKGRDLAENPHAALCFFWPLVERQVRLEGPVEKVSEAESDAYFAVRPRQSQVGAHASAQSQPLASRAALEARFAELDERFGAEAVPRPAGWGGYRLIPLRAEFWQGRSSRLHDRLVYRRDAEGLPWRRERLAP